VIFSNIEQVFQNVFNNSKICTSFGPDFGRQDICPSVVFSAAHLACTALRNPGGGCGVVSLTQIEKSSKPKIPGIFELLGLFCTDLESAMIWISFSSAGD
jgi:hypothetical protein